MSASVYAFIITGDYNETMLRASRDKVLEIYRKFGFTTVELDHSETVTLNKDFIQVTFMGIGEKTTPNDYLIVWYVGHGIGNWSFAGDDAKWDTLEISNYDLFEMLASSNRCRHITVISDGCGSGAITDDLTRWFSHKQNQQLLKGMRTIEHYHCNEGYEKCYGYGDWYPTKGLAFTLHLHEHMMDGDVKVNKSDQGKAWLSFSNVLYPATEGTKLMVKGYGFTGEQTQKLGSALVTGPAGR